ncbi:hypothetical protein DKX38_008881 [Salix brachista]|uniref:Uncharacterized protein n=1 Tax=Salix brachista TaxID=2182728 RepID=A0A5N5M980_9ROSI|nr:hypothetical protein DKX38_008881 [Salix brachista]
MEIKVVDLGCEKYRKKIKKILCKIPQIQSQVYVEEKNTVTITVVCCSPEKIKRKILRKGCGYIECIGLVAHGVIAIQCHHLHVGYLVEGHHVFRGEMVALAAKDGATLCVDVNISMKIIPHHAHSCKRAEKLRTPMIGVNVQHQPLDSNPVVKMDP